MSKEQLDLMYEAMKVDLSNDYDWDRVVRDNTFQKDGKTVQSKFITKHKWLSRIGKICHIGPARSLPFNKGEGVLNLTLDSEGFRYITENLRDGIKNSEVDKMVVKKMGFLAYNYQQLMQNKLLTIKCVEEGGLYDD